MAWIITEIFRGCTTAREYAANWGGIQIARFDTKTQAREYIAARPTGPVAEPTLTYVDGKRVWVDPR